MQNNISEIKLCTKSQESKKKHIETIFTSHHIEMRHSELSHSVAIPWQIVIVVDPI